MELETIHLLLVFLKIAAGLSGTILLALEVKKGHWGESLNLLKEHMNRTDEEGEKPLLKGFNVTLFATIFLGKYRGKVNAWLTANKKRIGGEEISIKSKEFVESAGKETQEAFQTAGLEAVPWQTLLKRKNFLNIGFWLLAVSFLLELIDIVLNDIIFKHPS